MNEYDVVVIGGGAAGLSAALVLARAQRRVAVVDAGEPRNAPAQHMHGFLSRDGLPPAELLRWAARRSPGTAPTSSPDGSPTYAGPATMPRASTSAWPTATSLSARRVLVATGLRDVLPDIPGVRERWGRDLLHCPYCHGYEVREQPLGVIGATPEAVMHAHLVRQWSPDVVLFTHDRRPGRGQTARRWSPARSAWSTGRSPASRRGRRAHRGRARGRPHRPPSGRLRAAPDGARQRRADQPRLRDRRQRLGRRGRHRPHQRPRRLGGRATSPTRAPRSSPPPARARPPPSRSTPTSSTRTWPQRSATSADPPQHAPT